MAFDKSNCSRRSRTASQRVVRGRQPPVDARLSTARKTSLPRYEVSKVGGREVSDLRQSRRLEGMNGSKHYGPWAIRRLVKVPTRSVRRASTSPPRLPRQ